MLVLCASGKLELPDWVRGGVPGWLWAPEVGCAADAGRSAVGACASLCANETPTISKTKARYPHSLSDKIIIL